MTYPNELTNPAQANWPVRVNEGFKSLRGPALYSHNDLTTTGLTEGFFGGDYGATAIADGTVALTNTTTNYIVAHRTTGTVSTSTATTNWNNTTTYGRVRRCVTAGGVTTGRIDWRFLESGIFDRTSVGGVGTVATDTIWDAAGDLVQGTGADTAARLPIGTALQVLRVNAGATAAEWAAASGNVAADAIWDAAGDLVQGTGANTGARLPIGTAGQVLKVNGGATAVEWGTAAGDVATDAIWDAAGDLVYGTGANTATRLPIGTALHVLRVNAGATAVEWAAAGAGGTIGRHMRWVPASFMTPRVSNGCTALAISGGASGQPDQRYLTFSASVTEYAEFEIGMEESWNEGTVTFAPVWGHESTTVNFGTVWALDAVAISNDDALATAFGTAQTSTDTGGTTGDQYTGPESSAITIAGTPAAGDTVYFRLARTPADGGDTLAVSARLYGIRLYWTTAAETD